MSGGITRIEHDSGQDTWLVVRKELTNATQVLCVLAQDVIIWCPL